MAEEQNEGLIRTPQQLLVVVALSFLVPVLAIIMVVQLVTGGLKLDPNSGAMTEEAVAKRLKPVGEVYVGEVPASAAAPVAAAGAPVPATAAAQAKSAGPADGKKVYETSCTTCHTPGIAGAPKTGDKTAWGPRIAQGKQVLYTHALKGKGAMPPKGGSMSLSDAEVKAAVDYIVSRAK